MANRIVTIRAILNGFVVDVGCQTIVVEGNSKKLAELVEMYYHPEYNGEMENRYLKTAVNAQLMGIDGPLRAGGPAQAATSALNREYAPPDHPSRDAYNLSDRVAKSIENSRILR